MIHPVVARETALEALERADRRRGAVRIRYADSTDAAALRRLAELETSPAAARELPRLASTGGVLVGELDGSAVAALALADGLLVGDPFARTAGVARLLRMRASQLARAAATRRRPRLRLRRA